MDFGEPARPARAEAALPMINLVFLLLIFFLMVATLAPRPPEAVEPPEVVEAARLEPDVVRVALGTDGQVAFGDMRGETALADLTVGLSEDSVVAIHADRRAPASALARLLGELDRAGATRVLLVAEPAR